MAVTIETYENSFVTFTDQNNKFISDRNCAFQREFCLPIYDGYDVSFLIKVVSTVSYVDITDYFGITLRNDCESQAYPTPPISIAPTFTLLDEISGETTTSYVLSVTYPGNWSWILEGGDCFVINLTFDDGDGNTASLCSNCFIKVDDKCFTTLVKYQNNETAFGFPYSDIGGIFDNYVRLPMWLSKPQYPKTGEYYERSNGEKVTLFARFNRQYDVVCDDMPEWWMKNLLIAISHDTVAVVPEDSSVLGNGVINVVSNNDWEIQWPDMGVSSANWGRPKFTLLETPFMEINNNCGA